jgi:hypothetical protein
MTLESVKPSRAGTLNGFLVFGSPLTFGWAAENVSYDSGIIFPFDSVSSPALFTRKKGARQMATYIVSYDLMKQGQNYTCIVQKLNADPIHWHAQGSVWIIETNQTAVQVRDHLQSCLDSNDKLIVARLHGEAAWMGYGDNITNWLKERLSKEFA